MQRFARPLPRAPQTTYKLPVQVVRHGKLCVILIVFGRCFRLVVIGHNDAFRVSRRNLVRYLFADKVVQAIIIHHHQRSADQLSLLCGGQINSLDAFTVHKIVRHVVFGGFFSR